MYWRIILIVLSRCGARFFLASEFCACLRLLQAVPLADIHTLGSCPHNGDNSAGRAKTPTTGGFLRGLKRGIIRSNSSGIEHFTLTDSVGLRFGLSVQPLDGRSSDGNACKQR